MTRRLNWGCGRGEPGWINADRTARPGIDIVGDILVDGLALDDESVDYAVSVHALQEIPYPHTVDALRELRRVLKPGGVLRLVLPDLDLFFDAYRRGDASVFQVPDEDAASIGAKFVVHSLWYGHTRTPLVFDYVRECAERAGFSSVTRCSFEVTASPFPGIVELDNREDESMYVEATR